TVAVNATINTASLSVGRHIIFVRGRGVNDVQSFQTWGPIGAAFLDVTGGPPTLQSAISRKTHGGAGTFDINLPLTGTAGIECRTAGGTQDYTMVVTFAGNVTVTGSPQAQVTSGTGCVGSAGTCTGNIMVSGNTVTIPLTNIANAQTINVRINGVNSAGTAAPATDFTIPMSILIGDTSANGTVNATDVVQTKGRLGQAVDATNFRSDVNANGALNATDAAIVKQNSGTSLPPD
ncbi:MAG: dockerin type I domain-containing protein, partial [Verrucomicrobiota bacterium]